MKNTFSEIKLFQVKPDKPDEFETLITYPMMMTHASIPKELREKMGITDRLLRLSVGIEDAGDIVRDLEKMLEFAG
jgi:cystathionine gamma-synthase